MCVSTETNPDLELRDPTSPHICTHFCPPLHTHSPSLKLGSCSQTSDKGATCLHNAVCSGSLPTVEYLVEMGCDINSQDIDGW